MPVTCWSVTTASESYERNPAALPWDEMGIDVVYECTGLFTDREKAAMHIQAGAKKSS